MSTTHDTKRYQAQTLRKIAEWVQNPDTAWRLCREADLIEGEPDEPVSTFDCPVCHGSGLVALANTFNIAALIHGMPTSPEAEACDSCEGAGTVPVTAADFPGSRRNQDEVDPF